MPLHARSPTPNAHTPTAKRPPIIPKLMATEHLNQTLAEISSTYVDLNHKTQDEILSYAMFTFNTALQETTRCTPF